MIIERLLLPSGNGVACSHLFPGFPRSLAGTNPRTDRDDVDPVPLPNSPSEGMDGEEETGLEGVEDELLDEGTDAGLDDATAEGEQADSLFDPAAVLADADARQDALDDEDGPAVGWDDDRSVDELESGAVLHSGAHDEEAPLADVLDDDLGREEDGELVRDGGEEGPFGEEEPLEEPELRTGGASPEAEELGDGVEDGLDEEIRVDVGEDALLWDDRAWQWTLGPVAVGAVSALRATPEGAFVLVARGEATEPLLVGPDGRVVPAPAGLPVQEEPDLGDFAVVGDRLLRRRGAELVAVRGVAGVLRATRGPGGGVLACVWDEALERVLLVRVGAGGDARIVGDLSGDLAAHVEGPLAADAEDVASGLRIAFDPARGWVWVGGSFGVAAYRS